MIVIERSPGEGVRVGRYTLRVLAVRAGEVVVALYGPEECAVCGGTVTGPTVCPVCGEEAILCPACSPSWRCPGCAPAPDE
jgi:hypothetical protein